MECEGGVEYEDGVGVKCEGGVERVGVWRVRWCGVSVVECEGGVEVMWSVRVVWCEVL